MPYREMTHFKRLPELRYSLKLGRTDVTLADHYPVDVRQSTRAGSPHMGSVGRRRSTDRKLPTLDTTALDVKVERK